MKRGGTPRVQYRCSFCGKEQKQVRRLIAGPGGVYICNERIDLCREIIKAACRRRPTRAHLVPLVAELEETRISLERLARENGALCEQLRSRGDEARRRSSQLTRRAARRTLASKG